MELYKDQEKEEIYLLTVTRNMGSCHCGNCLCKVFPDGTIEYTGSYSWQRSPRVSGVEALKRRSYGSQLGADGFNAAMAEFRHIFKKCGNSVFTKIGIDTALYRLIQIKDGKMRYLKNAWKRNKEDELIRRNVWTEWSDVSALPRFLSGNDICYRFAARVARGEISFPNFEERFGNNS